jgi:hypothetical protein
MREIYNLTIIHDDIFKHKKKKLGEIFDIK